MGKTLYMAKRINLGSIFIYLFLILFPFGQIINIARVHPVDVIVFCGALYAIFTKLKRPEVFKYFENFLIMMSCGWFASIFLFKDINILYGLAYLLRLASYFYFLVYVYNFARKSVKNRKFLISSLVLTIVVSAIFGWIQYFAFPDIKPFTIYGWDEHLYRIVGTFIDPSFLSLILVLGLIISPNKFIDLLLTVTLAFTYSRAGYLAFLPAVLLRKKYWLVAVLAILIFLLPRPTGESVKLERTASIGARLINYQESFNVFKKSPVIGIGFNNFCLARQKYIGFESFSSHSCGGSDSSLLFILATGGIIGLISFIHLSNKIWGYSDIILKTSFISIFVHSFFSNSLFYSWIMGVIVILLAVSLSGSEVKS